MRTRITEDIGPDSPECIEVFDAKEAQICIQGGTIQIWCDDWLVFQARGCGVVEVGRKIIKLG